jgi:hypothetical protein
MDKNIDNAIAAYVAALNAAEAARFARLYPSLTPSTYSVDPNGQKFVRIVAHAMGRTDDRSVHVFVERATGLIWKAAGWKGPARNFSRGSVFDALPEGEAVLGMGR